jgi:hypothetical protein
VNRSSPSDAASSRLRRPLNVSASSPISSPGGRSSSMRR